MKGNAISFKVALEMQNTADEAYIPRMEYDAGVLYTCGMKRGETNYDVSNLPVKIVSIIFPIIFIE